MYKFANSSPHSYLKISVTYREEGKKKILYIKSDLILLNFCLKLSFSIKLSARCGSNNVNVKFSLQPHFWRIMLNIYIYHFHSQVSQILVLLFYSVTGKE